MSVIAELEKKALSLPKKARGELVSKLIASLGSPFEDEDNDWVEEALRRDREMDDNPESVMTHEEFFASLKDYVK